MDPKIDALQKKAQKFLRSAAVLLELEDFDSTASRAYFSMFYAAQAALYAEMQSAASRTGIRSAFVARFVDTGRLPQRAADAFHQGHDLQEVGDYASDFAVSQAQAEGILQEAEAFVNSLERMIARQLSDAE